MVRERTVKVEFRVEGSLKDNFPGALSRYERSFHERKKFRSFTISILSAC